MLERLGSLSAARPRRTLLFLLFFLVLAGLVGGPVAGRLESGGGFATDSSESSRAAAQLERATGQQSAPGIVLLVEGGADDLAQRTRHATDELAAVPGIVETTAAGRSRDGEAALVTGTISATVDDEEVAEAVVSRFDGDERVVVGGAAVSGLQIGETVSEDLARAELIAFPLLILLALLFFRGRAALLPLVVGITTVLGTFLVLSGVNEVYGLSIFALNLVIGLGLGLAIDYTLFLVTRFREELGAGASTADAIRTTMSSAGRTVAFSAATVAVALATLTLFPLGFAQSMGIAGASVAIVAAVASLAISPALLAIWGAKLLPKDERRAAVAYDRWHRLAHAVMRRPGAVAAVTAALMLVVALPAAGVRWTPVDATSVPAELSSRVVSDAIERDFGGAGATPVTVAIDAPASEASAVDAFAAQVAALDGVRSVAPPADLGRDTWRVTATVPGDPAGATARDVVAEVRALDPAFPTAVTGPAAEFADQQEAIGSRLPIAVLVLCGLTFLVLWLMTGSVVLPAKAIVMNALTVGAALSPLLFIYQDGRLEGLLGFTSNGGVEPTNFLVTAALVFALSTDYGVFLLGRIKEARDGGESEREAVAVGLARTGRVVTAAAILLAVAIGVFSTSSIPFIQQIGIATAVGVLLDAFVVRTLLVPALMALLGKWNWWSPRPLRRLHERIGISEGPPAPAPAPAPLAG
ncbi:MMPL family transporter [Conexibacter stalactiti]|uniref:MMPL family transporter n=1 Tax=Conexibacter stalactiti TaxID=1940611 RepID=A0ABU4HMG0_9ACTN|nr:MMPL family transporter [Conexibacter stalactiti]MDW5594496.1 MMPL family transporter [Conexibacter stalactiti]MEC5035138.1 MMPL family transporter [Conexibacter stalactiti]